MSSWFQSSPHTNSKKGFSADKFKEALNPTSDTNVNMLKQEADHTSQLSGQQFNPGSGSGTGEGRRSSGATGFGGMVPFASLQAEKRDPNNMNAAQRRASIEDQRTRRGSIGKMWDNFTKGPVSGGEKSGGTSGMK
ncbi:hypothetical protein P152DRAFT_479575 [Eremomyces bilateralis CBS 781.70]|uniref:Conidiation-specific expression protein n=1 Tax=Eremomyces bilateralis CBS 781.70 TaxID=1392243 RepID=A0A6G1GCC9_9PEZI|nr:uncharacterized protein P152DRAFT_479575 [Eremomyces bilateralis CBS 781.70]KAF1815684.1 hypothetical protein P152DRAFT_479575 [Eremomyces bilateralis CBS 781.70]